MSKPAFRAGIASATSSERLARMGQQPDPEHMPSSARVIELGAIFATGARRLRLSLDGLGALERDCPAMDATPTEARA